MTLSERTEIIRAEIGLARQYLDEIEHSLQRWPENGNAESAYISGCMADDMVTSVRYHLREFTTNPRL